MSTKKRSPNSTQQNHSEVSALLKAVIFLGLILGCAVVAIFYYGGSTSLHSAFQHFAHQTHSSQSHNGEYVHTEQEIQSDIKNETEESAAAVKNAVSNEKASSSKPVFYSGKNMSVAIFPEKNGKTTFWLGIAFHKTKDGASCEGGLANSDSTALNHATIGRDRIILNQPLDKKGLNSCQVTLNVHSNVVTGSRETSIRKPGAKFKNSFDQMEASCAGQHGASCTFELHGSSSHPIMSRAALNEANLAKLASTFGSGEIDQLTAEMKRH